MIKYKPNIILMLSKDMHRKAADLELIPSAELP